MSEESTLEAACEAVARFEEGIDVVAGQARWVPTPDTQHGQIGLARVERRKVLLAAAVRAGCRETEAFRYKIRDAVRAHAKERQHFDWIVAVLTVDLGAQDADVERQIGEMAHAGEVVLYEDGTIQAAARGGPAADPEPPTPRSAAEERPLPSRALDTPILTDEERALVEAFRALTPTAREYVLVAAAVGDTRPDEPLSRADAGRLKAYLTSADGYRVPLGDTPEEIAEADALALFSVVDFSPEKWIEVREAILTSERRSPRGSHLRGIKRWLDRAGARAVARAAELDREQKRGSWAEPARSFPPGPTVAHEIRPGVFKTTVPLGIAERLRPGLCYSLDVDGDHGPWTVISVTARDDYAVDVEVIRWRPARHPQPDVHAAVGPEAVDSVCSAQGEVS